jgi:hypothetical protein
VSLGVARALAAAMRAEGHELLTERFLEDGAVTARMRAMAAEP